MLALVAHYYPGVGNPLRVPLDLLDALVAQLPVIEGRHLRDQATAAQVPHMSKRDHGAFWRDLGRRLSPRKRRVAAAPKSRAQKLRERAERIAKMRELGLPVEVGE